MSRHFSCKAWSDFPGPSHPLRGQVPRSSRAAGCLLVYLIAKLNSCKQGCQGADGTTATLHDRRGGPVGPPTDAGRGGQITCQSSVPCLLAERPRVGSLTSLSLHSSPETEAQELRAQERNDGRLAQWLGHSDARGASLTRPTSANTRQTLTRGFLELRGGTRCSPVFLPRHLPQGLRVLISRPLLCLSLHQAQTSPRGQTRPAEGINRFMCEASTAGLRHTPGGGKGGRRTTGGVQAG